jgi:hypothetical protein
MLINVLAMVGFLLSGLSVPLSLAGACFGLNPGVYGFGFLMLAIFFGFIHTAADGFVAGMDSVKS